MANVDEVLSALFERLLARGFNIQEAGALTAATCATLWARDGRPEQGASYVTDAIQAGFRALGARSAEQVFQDIEAGRGDTLGAADRAAAAIAAVALTANGPAEAASFGGAAIRLVLDALRPGDEQALAALVEAASEARLQFEPAAGGVQ